MKKHLFLINVLLVIITAYLGYKWYIGSSTDNYKGYKWKKTMESPLTSKEAAGREVKFPPISQFEIVGNKTLFRPERKEWVPPPPPPPTPLPVPKLKKVKKPAPAAKKATPPPPPPYPIPELFGIIIYDSGEKLAILRGHTREKTEPSSAPEKTGHSRRRSRRRVSRRRQPTSAIFPTYKLSQDKTKRYNEGQIISGCVIKKIYPTKVVLKRIKTGEIIELKLRGSGREKSQPASKSVSSPPQKINTKKKRPRLKRAEMLKQARRNLMRTRRKKREKVFSPD